VKARASPKECECSDYIPFLTNSRARVSGIVRYLVAGQVDVLPFDMRSGLLKLRPGSSLGMGYKILASPLFRVGSWI